MGLLAAKPPANEPRRWKFDPFDKNLIKTAELWPDLWPKKKRPSSVGLFPKELIHWLRWQNQFGELGMLRKQWEVISSMFAALCGKLGMLYNDDNVQLSKKPTKWGLDARTPPRRNQASTIFPTSRRSEGCTYSMKHFRTSKVHPGREARPTVLDNPLHPMIKCAYAHQKPYSKSTCVPCIVLKKVPVTDDISDSPTKPAHAQHASEKAYLGVYTVRYCVLHASPLHIWHTPYVAEYTAYEQQLESLVLCVKYVLSRRCKALSLSIAAYRRPTTTQYTRSLRG